MAFHGVITQFIEVRGEFITTRVYGYKEKDCFEGGPAVE